MDEVKAAVPYIVADIIEEKTGTRPSFSRLDVQVTITGGAVTVVLNGIGPAEMGQLNIADVTKETITRTAKWVAHATTLLGTVASTKEALSFEHDVLAGLQAGFAPPAAGGTVLIVKIPAADSAEVMAAIPAVHVKVGASAKAPVATTAAVVTTDTKTKDAKAAPGKKAGDKAPAKNKTKTH